MSMMPVSHFTWQLLRALKRGPTPLTGKQLRIVPSRKTKDGTFLDELVAQGLLEVAGVDPEDESNKKLPVQFRTRYRLTQKGEYAAEFGEYEREFVRPREASPAERPEPQKGNRTPRRSRGG